MRTRKEFNRAAAKAARKAGVYSLVMGEWDRLDRTLSPEAAVKALAMLLDPEEPAKAPKASKPASKPAKARKARKASEPKVEGLWLGPVTLTPIKVRAAIEAGMEQPAEVTDETVVVEVTLDLRFKPAKVLKASGFEVADGKATIRVADGKAVAQNVARQLAHLFRRCGVWSTEQGTRPGNVSKVRVVA